MRIDSLKKRRTLALAALLTSGALVLAGCSSDSDSEPETNETSESVVEDSDMDSDDSESESDSDSAGDAAALTPLPAFASTILANSTLAGQAVTQADFEGKPTIMWFWAPWCSVCRGEAPTLAEVATELEGTVDVVGVAALGSVDDMNAFVSDTGIGNFTQLADPDAEVWSAFGVVSQPAFAFIGADGSIDVVQGSIDKGDILERAQELS